MQHTTDGGATWTDHGAKLKGLPEGSWIPQIHLSVHNPDEVYVVANNYRRNDWSPYLYRTTDGGETWELVLYVDEGTGAIDLVQDPSDPLRLYAATWERRRLLWNDPRNDEATRGSGIWRTSDGGDSWVAVNAGLPVPAERDFAFVRLKVPPGTRCQAAICAAPQQARRSILYREGSSGPQRA